MESKPIKVKPTQNRLRVVAGALITAGVFLLMGGLLLFVARWGLGTAKVTPPRPGQAMSNIQLVDPAGSAFHMEDFRGRTVLINVWATWCPPCRREMPDLEAYYQAHTGDGFIILAVNAGESRDTAVRFANEMGLSFPIFLDPELELMNQLGINDYPTSIVVGPDGTVEYIHVGLISPEVLEEKVTPLLTQ